MRRAPRTGLVATLLVPAPAARAENGYEAKWLGQSPYLTLESGHSATSWFDAQNVGTATWTNNVVRLGTSDPRDRGSASRTRPGRTGRGRRRSTSRSWSREAPVASRSPRGLRT